MARSSASTVEEYLSALPADKRAAIDAVRAVVLRSLPEGYVEGMEYGMIYYSVPLSRYPETYNGHPLAETIASMPVDDYIALYEKSRPPSAKKRASRTNKGKY